MRKRNEKILLCFSLVVLFFAGCNVNLPLEEQEFCKQNKEIAKQKGEKKKKWVENTIPKRDRTYIEESNQMTNGERDMYINSIIACEPLNLTKEQKLEDFDFFWNTILEKMYCLEEVFEEAGVEYKEYIAQFRSQIAETKTDYEFWEIFDKSINICRGHWHAELLSPYLMLTERVPFSWEEDSVKEMTEDSQNRRLKYWDVLLSQNNYQYKNSRYQKNMSEAMPELKIIDEKTALITVPTFGYNFKRKEAGDLLVEHMKTVSDYENVIFDLKGNSGGVSWFSYHNLIAPNIDEPLTMTQVRFFKMKEDIVDAELIPDLEGGPWEYQVGYKKDKLYAATPLLQLPEDMRIKNGDYGNADYFTISDTTVFPRFDHRILKGKIWVLTYPENYSSAENFIITCKNTKFATLVGKQTKGDGGGGMSLRFTLPNSGLVGNIKCLWTLNEDGTNNANEGTRPDIESPKGETPLETCLRVIEESREG